MIMEFAFPHVVLSTRKFMSTLMTAFILETESDTISLMETMHPHGFPERLLPIAL